MNVKRSINRNLLRGKLTASNYEAANDNNIFSGLIKDMERNYISNLVFWSKDANWKDGGIEFNRRLFRLKGREDALTFMSNLNAVLQGKSAIELNLSGEFIFTIESDTEPLVFRIHVENGEISYEEAIMQWTEKKPFPV